VTKGSPAAWRSAAGTHRQRRLDECEDGSRYTAAYTAASTDLGSPGSSRSELATQGVTVNRDLPG